MKIWLRTGKANLTNGRTANGTSISHDELAVAFNRMGIECFDEFPTGNAYTAEAHTPDKVGEYIEMWYGDPSLWDIHEQTSAKARVAYTRCGKGKLPDVMEERLDMCDIVFVACTETQRDFETRLKPPVYVLSGGYLPELFHFVERDFDADPFIFLHAGIPQWRKGSKIACMAFESAFPCERDVQLLVMSPGESDTFMELQEEYQGDSRFVFKINPVLDRSLMLDEYYRDSHCLVFPSTWEGWGRCLTEAMASGMPGIVTQCSAMLEQFDEGCGWWTQVRIADHGQPEPLMPDLADKMRKAYNDRSDCKLKGAFAAEHAVANLTWETGITKILPLLNEIDSGGSV